MGDKISIWLEPGTFVEDVVVIDESATNEVLMTGQIDGSSLTIILEFFHYATKLYVKAGSVVLV